MTELANNPTLYGKPIKLGDLLKYAPGNASALEDITGDGTMVKGWSPCGQFVYLGWAGIVPLTECAWADPEKSIPVQRLYKAPTKNQWDQAIQSGLIDVARARGIPHACGCGDRG